MPNLQEPWFHTSDERCLSVGDCLDLLPRLPDASVDLVFAGTPYFLLDGGTTCLSRACPCTRAPGTDPLDPDLMYEFNRRGLADCQRVLTDRRCLWVSGTHHVIHCVGFAMEQLGFKVLSDLIWVESNPPPNFSCLYFPHANETLLWAAREPKSRHVFHYETPRKLANG